MKKKRSFWKIVAFDAAAVLCFIGVIAFGWLPGPGGIPLFLLGLSLLAANHDWAERWLETAKHHGVSFKKWIFPDKPFVRWTYDVVTLILFGAGLYLLFKTDNRLYEGGLVVIMCISLMIFLFNRDRIDKLGNLFKKKS